MEKRSIDDWLPSIDSLIKTIEKVIFFIQGSYISLKKQQDQIISNKQLLTLEEAINKRKEELKYYKKLLSSCQNSMKTKLQISQTDIFKKMDDIDTQILNINQIFQFLSEQSGLNNCIQNISEQIDKYHQRFALLNNEIHKTKIQLKSHEKIDSEFKSYISKIQLLKDKKRKVMHQRRQIASQRLEINQNHDIKIPAKKQNLKMKKALNNSISKLRLQITNFDREITDTERQKNEMQSLIKDTQNQFITIKKYTNDTISKTTQKTYFITNVIDEIKKLIKIRKDRAEINKKMNTERQHYFGFQSEINRINSKIEKLKMDKKKLINEECLIEENFLKKAMPKKKSKKRKKNLNKILLLNNNFEYSDDEMDDDSNETDHELIINEKKDVQEKQRKNLKLLKLVEAENAKIITLRQKIRETQENILFQVKLKKEKESLRKERENHSIFFSFEKLQNQIEEKKNNIEKLKQKIKEEKEFLSLYSQIEDALNDSDF